MVVAICAVGSFTYGQIVFRLLPVSPVGGTFSYARGVKVKWQNGFWSEGVWWWWWGARRRIGRHMLGPVGGSGQGVVTAR